METFGLWVLFLYPYLFDFGDSNKGSVEMGGGSQGKVLVARKLIQDPLRVAI